MIKSKLFMTVLMFVGLAAPTAAQSNWSAWTLHSQGFGMEAYYRTRVSGDDMRVQWRCDNVTDQRRACSVTGANRRKTYICYDGLTNLGESYGSAERSDVPPRGQHDFVSELACGGMGASSLRVVAEVRFDEG
jgi:hypothetical protein